jgi:UDP-glucose 4-epimerase
MEFMKILLCGGAGYIGSHMAKHLAARGDEVSVLDNLSTGHREAVKWGELFEVDLLDAAGLDKVFERGRFDAVMHFSGVSLVGESIRSPYAYYFNNVGGTLNLLQAMKRHEVERLVFSSTAAVYGQPTCERIEEGHPLAPISPYGESKLMVERILRDAANAYGLKSVSLRYFNAAGASQTAEIGESHQPETHLIPNLLTAALGRAVAPRIFGGDYPTPDGTCVRDYVHVEDLAEAHGRALDYLETRAGAHAFNLGSGQGYSVREVIAAVEEITGRPMLFEMAPPRAGDPAVLVASISHAARDLSWQPKRSGLHSIIESAWRWHADPKF